MDSQTSVRSNLLKMESFIRKTSADLIVFPECAVYCGSDSIRHQNEMDGELIHLFCEWARTYHVYLHCGSFVETGCKNTSILISNTGQIIGTYSKIHMFDVELDDLTHKESDTITPGDHLSICDTKIGTLGMSICYDIRFGEMFRLMALQGAQILCVVANFTKQTGQAHWRSLLRSRAIENTCFVVACGQVGNKEELGMEAYGHSMIIDPWGRVLLELDDTEQIQTADIDLKEIERVRRQIPSLMNRREDVYRLQCSNIEIYKE